MNGKVIEVVAGVVTGVACVLIGVIAVHVVRKALRKADADALVVDAVIVEKEG